MSKVSRDDPDLENMKIEVIQIAVTSNNCTDFDIYVVFI